MGTLRWGRTDGGYCRRRHNRPPRLHRRVPIGAAAS
jgi:hypothetical protein